jgi:hypothetical protein
LPNLEPKVLGFFVGRIHGRRIGCIFGRGALGIGYIGAPAETSEEKSSEGALTQIHRPNIARFLWEKKFIQNIFLFRGLFIYLPCN